ncbi:MAG: shikimate kinase [Lachnospiraceae bacterium]|jgi:shikimate kinase|nr:shikimate kinase [Lachnospiraceae bacterium]
MENIILTGYMGCGKTTVGKHVAKRLGYTFVDTDEMIVEQQHRSINEIFADDGETAFRVMETELLKQMIDAKRDHMVVATGGGMPIREENRRLLAVLGRVVYLKASPETIYGRVKEDTARPLLQCENPMKRIEEMLAIREPLYEAGAAVIVDVDGLRQAETASEIIERCGLK